MAIKLDLNALEQPTMELTLMDDDHTTLRLVCPDVKLIERLISAAPALTAVKDSSDVAVIKKTYELFADVLSNNEDGLRITAEELRDKYRVRFVHLVLIATRYLDFIREIQEAKN